MIRILYAGTELYVNNLHEAHAAADYLRSIGYAVIIVE